MSQSSLNSGVTSHSTLDIWQKFVIMSIDNEDNRLVRDGFEAFCREHHIDAVEVQGSYKGTTEHSWVIPYTQWFANFELIHKIYTKGQESVLVLSSPEKRSRLWRDAELWYFTCGKIGAIQPIGKFKQVSKKIALKHDGWTHNPNNNAYWIVE